MTLTTSRADWGHLSSPLKHLLRVPELEVSLTAIGSHLSPEFGYTIDEIVSDGFEVQHKVECLLSSDTDQGMAKTIGLATLSLSDLFARERPDILLLIADRYEMLAPASVALAHRIPVAHIEGGEVSEGAIDHAVRQALTAMAHIHFVPTATARKRLLAAGEESWRIHQVGAPSIDHWVAGEAAADSEVRTTLQLDSEVSPLVVAWHPTTLDGEVALETQPFFDALEEVDEPLIFCFPNADAGSRSIRDRAREYCDRKPQASMHVNLSHRLYWGLLKCAQAIIGNSSSGIMEAPALELPCLNIGRRQQGRERSQCIVDVPAQREEILKGIAKVCDADFRASLSGMTHAYGDGHAGERIAKVLADLPSREELLLKRALPADQIPEVRE
ncbi:UDP-N-acetylglucosamine 2-epimerase (hydrolyzing) [bacterium TMED181]|nr:UDP-N-acetylglucosamine 2-epimerase (hydrolyzing) [Planctomycetota bacterium]OUW47483.1 MAG: UDP-N-acetylglucosamine 2-epimerase (hydrolyzing) [bacterium TMED181]